MPAGVQWVMVVAGTVVTAVLFTGRLERRSGMVLLRSRPLTDAEAVAPAMTGLCRRGVGPADRDVLVATRDWGLTPYGFRRRTGGLADRPHPRS